MTTVVQWLLREQQLINKPRSPERPTYGEAEVLSEGQAAAVKIRNDGANQLGRLIRQAQKLRAEIAVLDGDIARLPEQPINGNHGQLLTAEEAQQRHTAVAAHVTKEADSGTLKHRLVPNPLRLTAQLVLVVDLPVFTLFSGDMLNVAWDQVAEGRSLLPAITAFIFGLLATVGVASILHLVGFELRGSKDHHGQPNVPKGRAGLVPKLLIAAAGSVSVGAAVVMGYRVIRESLAAEIGVVGALILGLFFAALVATLNLMVAITVFRDGSTQTDELRHLTRPLRRIRLQHLNFQRRKEQLIGQVDVLITEGRLVKQQTLLKLAGPIVGADQLRAIARSLHQACGWSVDLLPADSDSFGVFAPGIQVDTRVLDELLQQLEAMALPREPVLPDATEAGDGQPSNSTESTPPERAATGPNGQPPTQQGKTAVSSDIPS
ncbi:hypothetical protein [Nocardia brasiliensis]|uniref:hypothetical protein n=1 Tax=Nocardia brasiliensis TaxID=37326 RepID=UPI003D9176B0